MEYRLASFLLEVRPSLLETSGRTRGGLSPLHFAVLRGNSLATVQLLVERQPDSLRFRTPDGTSALHFAAERDEPSLALVRCIAESAPDLLHEVDSDRWLPLHVAVDHIEPSFDIVQFLVEQNPHSVGERTALGLLPLHVAAANPAPLQVVEFLVDRRPESVDQRDRDGSLPLHSAVASPEASLDVVRYLLEKRPSSVGSIDGAGLLPLHIAAVNDLPMDTWRRSGPTPSLNDFPARSESCKFPTRHLTAKISSNKSKMSTNLSLTLAKDWDRDNFSLFYAAPKPPTNSTTTFSPEVPRSAIAHAKLQGKLQRYTTDEELLLPSLTDPFLQLAAPKGRCQPWLNHLQQ
jgi:Ankyrin repeats (3 copies)